MKHKGRDASPRRPLERILLRITRRAVPTLLLIVTVPFALAQRATLEVSADSISIGEVFEIHIAVEHSPNARILFDDPGRDALHTPRLRAGDAELISLHRLPPEDRNGLRIDAARYTATAFALDSARIGPLEVGVVIGRDTSRIHVPGVILPVRSFVDPDSTILFGPAPPASFPRAFWPWLVVFAAALALAAAALLGMKWWKNRRSADTPLEPIIEARQTFQYIRDNADDTASGFALAADALRTYISRTWPVPARELTTRELARELGTHAPTFPQQAIETIESALKQADQVKFARLQPSPEQLSDVLQCVQSVVEELEVDRQRQLAEEAQETEERS